MHILLTGGGTAGHVNPAIAIAQILRRHYPSAVISFVGTPNGMENRLVTREGYPMYHVSVKGFSRSLSPKNIYAAYLAWRSPKVARKLLRTLKPDLVIGTGGYVSWPVLKAAALEGIPSMVHESNSVPGLTVKRLEKYVDRILLNFEDSRTYFKEQDKIAVVGNPLRSGFTTADRETVRASLGLSDSDRLILSFGGSLGATALNNACLTLMKDYVLSHENVTHVHGCGERNLDAFMEKLKSEIGDCPSRIDVRGYIANVPDLMQAADVIITRAGAMTLSEIALSGRASILIPSPNVTNDHQKKNASLLANGNAAIMLEEGDELAKNLTRRVDDLLSNDHFRKTVARNARHFAKTDANDRIAAEIRALLARK